jgi:hypothetical protein
LRAADQAGSLKFFGAYARLEDARVFKAYLGPLHNIQDDRAKKGGEQADGPQMSARSASPSMPQAQT